MKLERLEARAGPIFNDFAREEQERCWKTSCSASKLGHIDWDIGWTFTVVEGEENRTIRIFERMKGRAIKVSREGLFH